MLTYQPVGIEEAKMVGQQIGSTSKRINQPAAKLWEIVAGNKHLSNWVPAVKSVDPADSIEVTGAIRRCEVEVEGRHGYVVERCIDSKKHCHLIYLVDEDSLGFGKMIKNFGFSIKIAPAGSESTTVTLETFGDAANVVSRILIPLMLKRKFEKFRENMIASLDQYASNLR